jgi:4-amino-4-deoxy-L-arabinose transferase-like glycosyltransferase
MFLGDEGRDALVVWEMLHGDLTLLGPTSSVGGFFLGPIYYYLMAPFLWLSNYDPVGPAIMVVLFGLTTIYLVYRLGKEFFGPIAGIIAALLYAVSPIIITYSRSSWNPNVFPFFTITSLYSLYKAVEKNKWWLFVLSGILMGINLQIHYLATFVGAIMFFYVTFVDFRLKAVWVKELVKRYALMLGGFLIGFSPFIAFEVRHSFTNSQNIINFIFNSPDTGFAGNIFMNVKIVFDRLFGGLVLSYPEHLKEKNFDPQILDIWYPAGVLLGLILIGFFLYSFFKNHKDKKDYRKYFLIFIWGFVGIGLFLLYKKSVYDYYLGFLFPLPYLLIGLLAQFLVSKYKMIGIIIVSVFAAVVLIINLKLTPISIPGNQQVNQVKMISEFILDKTNGEPFNFAISGAGNSDHAYRYFFRLAGRDPVQIYGLNIDPKRVTVTDQLFVVCEQKPCAPLGESRQEISGFGRAEIEDEWDVSVVRIYKLKHYTGKEE